MGFFESRFSIHPGRTVEQTEVNGMVDDHRHREGVRRVKMLQVCVNGEKIELTKQEYEAMLLTARTGKEIREGIKDE